MRALLVLSVFLTFIDARAGETVKFGEKDWTQDPASRLVFFAVLEGLYSDGVANEAVDAILCRDPKTGEINAAEHFVFTCKNCVCPLCGPVLDALRLYRQRPEFTPARFGSTFGKGLDAKATERLKSPKKEERLAAIQELVQKWVSKRLDSMRLTEEERGDWASRMLGLRKFGSMMLSQAKTGKDPHGEATGKNYGEMKSCPSCDGGYLGASK